MLSLGHFGGEKVGSVSESKGINERRPPATADSQSEAGVGVHSFSRGRSL